MELPQRRRAVQVLDLIANNVSTSLTAGSTILAVGVALGAVGLTEIDAVNRSPFTNGWVRTGAALGAVGASWTLATFVIALAATRKAALARRYIAQAHYTGNRLEEQGPSQEQAEAWAHEVSRFLTVAFGEAERELFWSHHDLSPESSEHASPSQLWLRRRLLRLMDLAGRSHAMTASFGLRRDDAFDRMPADTVTPSGSG